MTDGAAERGESAAQGGGAAAAADPASSHDGQARHVVIIGFGLSGRAAVNAAIAQGVSYTVVEANRVTVERCAPGGLHIIEGDARNAAVLRAAGIERATEVAVTVPDDSVTLDVVQQARALNPAARIIARCAFVSGGMEAHRRGADETVIAEQVVAAEFGRVIGAVLHLKG
jgi:voltage-gated potassium channel Kch